MDTVRFTPSEGESSTHVQGSITVFGEDHPALQSRPAQSFEQAIEFAAADSGQLVTDLERPVVHQVQWALLQPDRVWQGVGNLKHLPEPQRIEVIEEFSEGAPTRCGAVAKAKAAQDNRVFLGEQADPAQRFMTAEQGNQNQPDQCRKRVALPVSCARVG